MYIFAQFGVEPSAQSAGIGSLLIDTAAAHARSANARELACDTAIPASHLVAYYRKRGFRSIEEYRWPHATYASIILSKTL